MNDNESRNSIDTLLNAIGDPQSKKVGFSNSVSIKYSKKLKDEKERKAYAKSKIENYTHVLTLSSNTLPPDEADKKAILLLQDNTYLRIHIVLDPGDDKPSIYTINKDEANAIIQLAPKPGESSKNIIKQDNNLLIENILEALYDIEKTTTKSTSHHNSQSSGAASDTSTIVNNSLINDSTENNTKNIYQEIDEMLNKLIEKDRKKLSLQYFKSENFIDEIFFRTLYSESSQSTKEAQTIGDDNLKNYRLHIYNQESNKVKKWFKEISIKKLLTIPEQLYPQYTVVHFLFKKNFLDKLRILEKKKSYPSTHMIIDTMEVDTKINPEFQNTINLILSTLPEEALLWHIDYLLWNQLNIIANMPMEEGANLVNKAFEDLIRGSRFPKHLEKFSNFCQELEKNNIHTSHYTQKLPTGSFFFTSKKDLIEKIQWFEYLHNAERGAYLIGIILIIMTGLEAGNIMPSLSSSDLTYTLVFSLLGCLCLGGGYAHRRYRQIQQKPMDAAVGILSALRNPSFFQEPEDLYKPREQLTPDDQNEYKKYSPSV